MAHTSRNGPEYKFANTGWDKDSEYSPLYPPSLVKLIMDFHRAHSNSLRLAHDIEAGSGSLVPRLAEYFQHIHISDRNGATVAEAREMLGAWYAENWWKAKLSFSTLPAERAGEAVVDGSLDFACMMDCSHRVDIQQTIQSIGRSLAPNGTLAVVLYNRCPTIIGNEEANEAFRSLYMVLSAFLHHGDEDLTQLRQSNAALEDVPLPEEIFIQDVTKRIKINFNGAGDEAFAVPGLQRYVAPSRANSQHRRYEYNNGDPEAEGWRQVVDTDWIRGYIKSLGAGAGEDQIEDLIRPIIKAIESTSPNGRVLVEWMVAVLLATRK